MWNMWWICKLHRRVQIFESSLQKVWYHISSFITRFNVSRPLRPIYHSSSANVREYTVTRMSIPMQLQCMKRITEYPLALIVITDITKLVRYIQVKSLRIIWKLASCRYQVAVTCMMTSSNGNIFRVTAHLCGQFTGPRWFPAQRPMTRSFDIFFDLRLNKRLCKQPWGW